MMRVKTSTHTVLKQRVNNLRQGRIQQSQPSYYRKYSSSNDKPITASLNSRWLSDIKQRIGQCLSFGINEQQKSVAGNILQVLAQDWRELVVGSEGFLTSPIRRGLYRYPIAWGEQDPMGHINNIVYNRWAESGRIRWTRNFGDHLDPEHAAYWRQLMIPIGEGLILREITTKYKFPLKYPDQISVYHKLSSKPDRSNALLLDCVILSETHRRIAARTFEDIALYDYDRSKTVEKQSWMLDLFTETWRLQQETKDKNNARVHALLDQVRRLELDSWDRPDAVEDMGTNSSSKQSPI